MPRVASSDDLAQAPESGAEALAGELRRAIAADAEELARLRPAD